MWFKEQRWSAAVKRDCLLLSEVNQLFPDGVKRGNKGFAGNERPGMRVRCLVRRHVEPRRRIPHAHPATVTCDSRSCSAGPTNTNTSSSSVRGGRQECRWKGERKRLPPRLHRSFSPSILHPPLLSEAVTPARRTSLARRAPSPGSSVRNGKNIRKVRREGGREDQRINGHSWSLWCSWTQRSNEP